MMNDVKRENGAALVVTLGLLLLITLLGVATIQWSVDELGIAANQKASVQARYIAESGVALMLQWFQEPGTFPEIGVFPNGEPTEGRSSFLKRRQINSQGAASFFNPMGKSQFSGTNEQPDFLYQPELGEPGSQELVGDAVAGLGALTSLKLFGPRTVGAVGAVEATGTTRSGIGRTVSVEIVPSPIPPTTAAVQIGSGPEGSVPILVHWGDVRIMGNADLGSSLLSIPKKDLSAPVNGQPYSSSPQDAWLDFFVGGSILNPSTSACPDCTEPFGYDGYGHLHQFQEKVESDFGLDPWEYQRLKSFAKTWGIYFATDADGFLYQVGIDEPARRMTPAQALASAWGRDHPGFVFIDTLDQNPPNGTNLATLDLPIDYLQGIFSIQANVVLRESGPGRSIQVQSPPFEGTDDPSGRQTVFLSNIHLEGVLSVAGRLTVEGHPMVFGALVAQQGITGSGQPEVWYDADLRTGYYSGLPIVTILKGSWYVR